MISKDAVGLLPGDQVGMGDKQFGGHMLYSYFNQKCSRIDMGFKKHTERCLLTA
jgi:hypothetical protein